MRIIATITSSETVTKSGTSARTNRQYSITEQAAIVQLSSGERRKISLQVDVKNGEKPLTPGDYEPKDDALYVAGFGKLELSQRARNWQPAKKAA